MLSNVNPVMSSALRTFIRPQMSKWRVHYSYDGECGFIDTWAFTDDHAWDKGRTNAARRHLCKPKDIHITECEAI